MAYKNLYILVLWMKEALIALEGLNTLLVVSTWNALYQISLLTGFCVSTWEIRRCMVGLRDGLFDRHSRDKLPTILYMLPVVPCMFRVLPSTLLPRFRTGQINHPGFKYTASVSHWVYSYHKVFTDHPYEALTHLFLQPPLPATGRQLE